MKNKYLDHAHVSEAVFRSVLRYFCADIEAVKTAELTKLSRQTTNKLYMAFRSRIADLCDSNLVPTIGIFEMDESYFGARRVRGQRGRGARGKTIVFGILKRGGSVYTQVVKDCSKESLLPIIQEIIAPNSTIYTDGFRTYSCLQAKGYTNHSVIDHGNNIFAVSHEVHTNGIENFWGVCKVRMTKFRGLNNQTFYLHLKECEFRYNNRYNNIYKLLLDNFRLFPLKLS